MKISKNTTEDSIHTEQDEAGENGGGTAVLGNK